jgi:hypothetical protein
MKKSEKPKKNHADKIVPNKAFDKKVPVNKAPNKIQKTIPR